MYLFHIYSLVKLSCCSGVAYIFTIFYGHASPYQNRILANVFIQSMPHIHFPIDTIAVVIEFLRKHKDADVVYWKVIWCARSPESILRKKKKIETKRRNMCETNARSELRNIWNNLLSLRLLSIRFGYTYILYWLNATAGVRFIFRKHYVCHRIHHFYIHS